MHQSDGSKKAITGIRRQYCDAIGPGYHEGVQTLYFDGATGHAQKKFGLGTGIPYSAKFSHVFIFVNSEPLTKNISVKFFDIRCV